jgi:hypothetical protein
MEKKRGPFGMLAPKYLIALGFTLNCIIIRKNPMVVIEAFRRAFPANELLRERVGLVI